jgi:hypothetical protein
VPVSHFGLAALERVACTRQGISFCRLDSVFVRFSFLVPGASQSTSRHRILSFASAFFIFALPLLVWSSLESQSDSSDVDLLVPRPSAFGLIQSFRFFFVPLGCRAAIGGDPVLSLCCSDSIALSSCMVGEYVGSLISTTSVGSCRDLGSYR